MFDARRSAFRILFARLRRLTFFEKNSRYLDMCAKNLGPRTMHYVDHAARLQGRPTGRTPVFPSLASQPNVSTSPREDMAKRLSGEKKGQKREINEN